MPVFQETVAKVRTKYVQIKQKYVQNEPKWFSKKKKLRRYCGQPRDLL
jgi:hypothetical protein